MNPYALRRPIHEVAMIQLTPEAKRSFADDLASAYDAGRDAARRSVPRDPPFEDVDLAQAWTVGYDSVERA